MAKSTTSLVSESSSQRQVCKHTQVAKKWTGEIDYSPGVHRTELGREYKYDCPDCGATWKCWE